MTAYQNRTKTLFCKKVSHAEEIRQLHNTIEELEIAYLDLQDKLKKEQRMARYYKNTRNTRIPRKPFLPISINDTFMVIAFIFAVGSIINSLKQNTSVPAQEAEQQNVLRIDRSGSKLICRIHGEEVILDDNPDAEIHMGSSGSCYDVKVLK